MFNLKYSDVFTVIVLVVGASYKEKVQIVLEHSLLYNVYMSEITHYTLLAPAGAREEADNLIKNLLAISLPPLSTQH